MNQKTIEEAEQAGFHFAQSHQNDPMGARVAYEVIVKIEKAELLRHTQVPAKRLSKEILDIYLKTLGKILQLV